MWPIYRSFDGIDSKDVEVWSQLCLAIMIGKWDRFRTFAADSIYTGAALNRNLV